MDLEYALLYPAKPSVYCGGQTHLSFSSRYGVSWIKKADCSGTVEEIASEGWLIGVLYHMDPVRKILATIKADTQGDESNIAWCCDYLSSNVLKVSSGELSPFFIWPGWSLWLLQGCFFVLCNKTSVIKDFFLKMSFGKRTGDMDCRQLFGSRGSVFARLQMEMKGEQGLEVTLKLNPSIHTVQAIENSINLLSCTWSKVWQERDGCRHYSLCGVFLRMLLVNVNLLWKLQQVWITTLITLSLHSHALADLLEDLGKLQCWWNNLIISRKRIFFFLHLTEEIKFTYWRCTVVSTKSFFWWKDAAGYLQPVNVHWTLCTGGRFIFFS